MQYKDLPWFCPEPFVSLQTLTTGEGQICCWDAKGYEPNIKKTNSIKKLFDSDTMRTVRSEMLAGKTPANSDILYKYCKTCWLVENKNVISWRKTVYDSFHEHYNNYPDFKCDVDDLILNNSHANIPIKNLKLRIFGILCSLQCIMCDETRSSSHLKQIEKETGIKQNLKQYDVWNELDKEKIIQEIVSLRHLKKIIFTSGEPIISDQLIEFLDMLAKANATKLELVLFTGSVNYSTKLSNILKKYEKITVQHSIDGIGSIDELIRTGTNWNKKVTIIDKWQNSLKEKYQGQSFTTVQALNAGYITDIYGFCTSKNIVIEFIILNGPEFLSVHALPQKIKKQYYEKIENIDHLQFNKIKKVLLLEEKNQEYLWKQFKIFILSKNKQDLLFKTHPELVPYF